MVKSTAKLHKLKEDFFLNKAGVTAMAIIGAPVLPQLRKAYTGLDSRGFLMAQWYNCIMAAIATDPVGEALQLLELVEERQ